MSGGHKQFKGQLQIIEGSPTGEPIVITRLSHDSIGNIEYMGEAKVQAADNQHMWFLEKLEYDSLFNVTAIKTATNKCSTGATQVSVSLTANPGFVTITLVGGDFEQIRENDQIFLNTVSNQLNSVRVYSATPSQVLIAVADAPSAIAETNTAINSTDLTFLLQNENTKDFNRRRWDKRTLYVYA